MERRPQQFHYVFTTAPEEAALYNIVQPVCAQVSEESVNPHTLATSVTRVLDFSNQRDPQWPANVPKISISVDQQSGQVNVLVTPVEQQILMARSPAAARLDYPTAEEVRTPVVLVAHNSVGPPPNSRDFALSPAGLAIRSPGGMNYVPAGSIKTPNGTIWTPKGVSYSPGGTCYWPPGTTFDEEGGAITPAGTTYKPDGFGFGPNGHVYTPQGTAYSPSGLAYTAWRGTYAYQKDQQPPSQQGQGQGQGQNQEGSVPGGRKQDNEPQFVIPVSPAHLSPMAPASPHVIMATNGPEIRALHRP